MKNYEVITVNDVVHKFPVEMSVVIQLHREIIERIESLRSGFSDITDEEVNIYHNELKQIKSMAIKVRMALLFIAGAIKPDMAVLEAGKCILCFNNVYTVNFMLCFLANHLPFVLK